MEMEELPAMPIGHGDASGLMPVGSLGNLSSFGGSAGNLSKLGSVGNLPSLGSYDNLGNLKHMGSVGNFGELLESSVGNVKELGSAGNLRELGSVGNLKDLGSLGNSKHGGSIANLQDFGSTANLKHLGSMGNLRDFGSAGNLKDLGSLETLKEIGSLGNLRRMGSVSNVRPLGLKRMLSLNNVLAGGNGNPVVLEKSRAASPLGMSREDSFIRLMARDDSLLLLPNFSRESSPQMPRRNLSRMDSFPTMLSQANTTSPEKGKLAEHRVKVEEPKQDLAGYPKETTQEQPSEPKKRKTTPSKKKTGKLEEAGPADGKRDTQNMTKNTDSDDTDKDEGDSDLSGEEPLDAEDLGLSDIHGTTGKLHRVSRSQSSKFSWKRSSYF
uniref:Uncharacterized protein n=1 Tax=Rhodosorus marinus TaxID=101924 RepID=A0A7S2ZHN0_9RHOD|mmetsp:Transcript_18612/g.74824  ORF Transcript_18612/g.74824 Transcript_18612/m.74824 type:complete len:383 (+) Transcript_18612:523-1671(+)